MISAIAKAGAELTRKLNDGKTCKTSISGSRTKLLIAGRRGDRKDLNTGQAARSPRRATARRLGGGVQMIR